MKITIKTDDGTKLVINSVTHEGEKVTRYALWIPGVFLPNGEGIMYFDTAREAMSEALQLVEDYGMSDMGVQS